MILLQED
jgi:hypothetical protein